MKELTESLDGLFMREKVLSRNISRVLGHSYLKNQVSIATVKKQNKTDLLSNHGHFIQLNQNSKTHFFVCSLDREAALAEEIATVYG